MDYNVTIKNLLSFFSMQPIEINIKIFMFSKAERIEVKYFFKFA